MRTEAAVMTLEKKLQKVYMRAFHKRQGEDYEKIFAEAYAEGFKEGYEEGLTEAILELAGYVEADALARRLEISEEDILRIWEQA